MKIAFCTPFKPIDHPSVSGDVTIARDLCRTLRDFGHDIVVLDHFPAKELYWKPGKWAGAVVATHKMIEQAEPCDCWLTYGTYYKVPDIFGPTATKRLNIPYCIFQASYAENRRKKLKTWPGFMLNRRAMRLADHVICNRINDMRGCAKLLPTDRYTPVKPGLPDALFQPNHAATRQLRDNWHAGDIPVIITAAMMRPGVKHTGLQWVIDACATLMKRGRKFRLVIAGDGPMRSEIESTARKELGQSVIFLGMVPRKELPAVFSAGDIFAFPGLEESVGMVYLEAQACGLPCVATDDEGAPNVIRDGYSGIITPVSIDAFTNAVDKLLSEPSLCQQLGDQAITYVNTTHVSTISYQPLNTVLERLVEERKYL